MRRRSEDARILLEALEAVRGFRGYVRLKPGHVQQVKALLRKAGVPVPRPYHEPTPAHRAAGWDEMPAVGREWPNPGWDEPPIQPDAI
jgi:hypothetical protein